MDFSGQLDALQQQVAEARSVAMAAAAESRDQLRRRIDQAQIQVNLGMTVMDGEQGEQPDQGGKALASRRSKWSQMKADAFAAIDYAEWVVDSVRLAVLEAIEARAHADECARAAS